MIEFQRKHDESDAEWSAACGDMARALAKALGREDLLPPALAAAAREGGDVQQAPAESPQSGPTGNAQKGGDHD